MYRCDDDKAVSHTSTAVEVDLPIDEVFRFLSDIQNASVWHPLVRGATKWTHHVSNYVPDERPIRVGSTYRLLFGAPLADLVRLRVTAYAPPREIEWSGVGHLRRLRLRLQLSPVAHSPKQRTRIDAQWWWQWLGWRRVPGLARDAHLAARAVAASTQLSLPAALAQL